jgi:ATP-dependent exoDNAse (exonuclease V) beta subunit
MYKEYESDMMILFSNNRLLSHYDQYFSNNHIPSHPVTCHLNNVSLKLHLYDGIITLHAVDDSDQHPYYLLLSTSVLKTTNLDVNLLNIYMPFQSSELGMY